MKVNLWEALLDLTMKNFTFKLLIILLPYGRPPAIQGMKNVKIVTEVLCSRVKKKTSTRRAKLSERQMYGTKVENPAVQRPKRGL